MLQNVPRAYGSAFSDDASQLATFSFLGTRTREGMAAGDAGFCAEYKGRVERVRSPLVDSRLITPSLSKNSDRSYASDPCVSEACSLKRP
jgi:hypothetical protein